MDERELSRGQVLALLPVVVAQGTWVRRRTPQLPEAEGREGQVGRGLAPLRLAVIGDSVAAGQGVGHHERSLAGELARRLHARYGRAVAWSVLAQGGLTAGEIRRLVAGRPEVEEADFVVVSVGVNDTKDLHSDARWSAELRDLLAVLRGHSQVVLLGVPPMETLPALPRPLAGLLGGRARRLDRLGRETAAGFTRVHHLPLAGIDLDADGAHAPDGFHPSARTHAEIAKRIDHLLA